MLHLRRRLILQSLTSSNEELPGETPEETPTEGTTWQTRFNGFSMVVNTEGDSKILNDEKIYLKSGNQDCIKVFTTTPAAGIYCIKLGYDTTSAPDPLGEYFLFKRDICDGSPYCSMPKLRYNKRTVSSVISGKNHKISRDSVDLFLPEGPVQFEIRLTAGEAFITCVWIEAVDLGLDVEMIHEVPCPEDGFVMHVKSEFSQGFVDTGGVMLRPGDQASFTMPSTGKLYMLGVLPDSSGYGYYKNEDAYEIEGKYSADKNYPYGTSQGAHCYKVPGILVLKGEKVTFTCKSGWAHIVSLVVCNDGSITEKMVKYERMRAVSDNMLEFVRVEINRDQGEAWWKFSVDRKKQKIIHDAGYSIIYGCVLTLMKKNNETVNETPAEIINSESGGYIPNIEDASCLLAFDGKKYNNISTSETTDETFVFSYGVAGLDFENKKYTYHCRGFVRFENEDLTYTSGSTKTFGSLEIERMLALSKQVVTDKACEQLDADSVRWTFSVNKEKLNTIVGKGYSVSFGCVTTLLKVGGRVYNNSQAGVSFSDDSGFQETANDASCTLVYNSEGKYAPSGMLFEETAYELVFSCLLSGFDSTFSSVMVACRAFLMFEKESITYTDGYVLDKPAPSPLYEKDVVKFDGIVGGSSVGAGWDTWPGTEISLNLAGLYDYADLEKVLDFSVVGKNLFLNNPYVFRVFVRGEFLSASCGGLSLEVNKCSLDSGYSYFDFPLVKSYGNPSYAIVRLIVKKAGYFDPQHGRYAINLPIIEG